jgi:transcriptional regulator with XRE-family HTH domain
MREMATGDWYISLRGARQRANLTRKELARLSGIALETLRAYETGRRKPSRDNLETVLQTLKLDRTEGNRIRLSLGLAPDSRDYGVGDSRYYRVEELQAEMERLPWPVFAPNELMDLVFANTVALRLWRVDLSREFLEPGERNFFRIASNPRFADRVVNWDEAVGTMVGMWKGHHRGRETLEQPSPYFQRLLQDFLAGDPKYVRRLLDLWERVPAREPKVRFHYRPVIRDPEVGEMRFLGILGPANETEALAWHDWIPTDAESWQRLTTLVSG